MTRQRICALAVALLAAGGLAGCSVGPVDLDDFIGVPSVGEAREARRSELAPVVADSSLKQAGTLTVGIPTDQAAPLAITTADGTQTGIDVDTAYALADELGLSSVTFVPVSDVSSALTDTCDVVMGVAADDAGDASVVGGYAQTATGLFTRGDVTAPIDSSDLDGATVGLQEGSVSAVTLDDYDLSVTRTPFTNLNEAFEALEEGTVQYVVCDAYAGAYLAAAYSDVSFAGILDEPESVGVAVSGTELQTAVQSALETVQGNGVADVARARWVGDLPVLTAESTITGLTERPEEPPAEEGAEDGSGAEADADTDASTDATTGAEAEAAPVDAPETGTPAE